MTQLTPEYIDDHLHRIHTADSFGRGLCYMILSAAKERADGRTPEISIDCTATVAPIESMGCIRICVDTPFGRLCYHAEV